MTTADIIKFAASGFLSALFLALTAIFYAKSKTLPPQYKPNGKRKKYKPLTLSVVGLVVSVWYLIGTVIGYFSGLSSGLDIDIEMMSPRVELFGFSVARTTLTAYVITLIVLVLGVIFRLFVFPGFRESDPGTVQILLESMVEEMDKLAGGATGNILGDGISSYFLAVAVFMVFSAFSELFGLRAPTSDIVMNFPIALMTLFLINYFGIKMKGIGGRIGTLMNPTPVVFPFKIISDLASPVSLSCRLFGNMLGGMIVMDLLKSSLGAYAVGIPAVAGLYFNLFHPGIQAYIFIILSLTFINEAVE